MASKPLEKEIERYFVNEIRKTGGSCLKFVCPGLSGVPDRLILLPAGQAFFAEMKAPGRKMRPLQEVRKRQLERLGFRVFCIDSKEQADKVLGELRKGGEAGNEVHTA